MLIDVESMGELLNRFFASVFSREQGGGDRNVEESEDDHSGVDSGGRRDQCINYGSDGERAVAINTKKDRK